MGRLLSEMGMGIRKRKSSSYQFVFLWNFLAVIRRLCMLSNRADILAEMLVYQVGLDGTICVSKHLKFKKRKPPYCPISRCMFAGADSRLILSLLIK